MARLAAGGAAAGLSARLSRRMWSRTARRQAAAGRSQEAPAVHRLFYINLDRRPERRERFERQARSVGLRDAAVRFPAVDGGSIDFARYPRTVVTPGGIQRAQSPPPIVNGVELTPGALGLILSYNTILKRIAADPEEDHVYVIAEDDAQLVDDFCPAMRQSLDLLNREHPDWDFLHIGYYEDDCSVRALEGPAGTLFCTPLQIYGLFGAAVRPRGARALLECLFPLDEQIDSALAHVYHRINAFALRRALMTAAHSTAGNSDIQLLPEGFKFQG